MTTELRSTPARTSTTRKVIPRLVIGWVALPSCFLRHRMYSSTSVLYLATAIALGSRWTLIPAVLCVVVLVVRIHNEEEVLVRELPGYPDERARVRHRLVPGIW
jgi:protein-S-isoprenylcysteine O-methyltransferase Ste14